MSQKDLTKPKKTNQKIHNTHSLSQLKKRNFKSDFLSNIEASAAADLSENIRNCLWNEDPIPEIKLTNKQIIGQILEETNKYRRMHCACRLVLYEYLMQYAQQWADHLAFKDKLETRPYPQYGENIMCCRKRDFDVARIIRLWYQEKYAYEYANPEFSPYTGHFTQLIWWETRELGVGIAQNAKRIWIVCNYHPHGNVAGHYKENVLPRKLMLSSSEDEVKPKYKCRPRREIDCENSKPQMPPSQANCIYQRRKCENTPDYQRFSANEDNKTKPIC